MNSIAVSRVAAIEGDVAASAEFGPPEVELCPRLRDLVIMVCKRSVVSPTFSSAPFAFPLRGEQSTHTSVDSPTGSLELRFRDLSIMFPVPFGLRVMTGDVTNGTTFKNALGRIRCIGKAGLRSTPTHAVATWIRWLWGRELSSRSLRQLKELYPPERLRVA